MRLLLHCGLHKTASTYLQHVLLLNRQMLNAHGVYLTPDTRLTANHGSAWMALGGDLRHIEAHVAQARTTGCDTAILSSEDFEGLIFLPERAAALEHAVRASGVDTIEWHFCLRDPGDYFLSLYAELARHTFVDFLSMFIGIVRDGKYRVDRERRRYPAFWEFCFDYEQHLAAFAEAGKRTLVLHDFRDSEPFPGHRLFEQLTNGHPAEELPGPGSRNRRPDTSVTSDNLRRQVERTIGPVTLPDPVVADLLGRISVDPGTSEACAAAIRKLFAPGMERLLAAGRFN